MFSSLMPGGVLVILLVYGVLAAVIVLMAYLAVRFGVRDGLRGHRLWLERTGRSTTSAPGGEGQPRT